VRLTPRALSSGSAWSGWELGLGTRQFSPVLRPSRLLDTVTRHSLSSLDGLIRTSSEANPSALLLGYGVPCGSLRGGTNRCRADGRIPPRPALGPAKPSQARPVGPTVRLGWGPRPQLLTTLPPGSSPVGPRGAACRCITGRGDPVQHIPAPSFLAPQDKDAQIPCAAPMTREITHKKKSHYEK